MCIVVCIHTCNRWHPIKFVIKPLMQMSQFMSRNAGRVRTFRVDTGRQMQMQHLRGIFSYLARNVSNMPKSILVLDCLRYICLKTYGCVRCFLVQSLDLCNLCWEIQYHVNKLEHKKTGSLVFFSGYFAMFLECQWKWNDIEMTIWPCLQIIKPLYFTTCPPAPDLNSMHGGHTKDHAGPAHGAAASLWGAAWFPVKQHENSGGNSYRNPECTPEVTNSPWNLTMPQISLFQSSC